MDEKKIGREAFLDEKSSDEITDRLTGISPAKRALLELRLREKARRLQYLNAYRAGRGVNGLRFLSHNSDYGFSIFVTQGNPFNRGTPRLALGRFIKIRI